MGRIELKAQSKSWLDFNRKSRPLRHNRSTLIKYLEISAANWTEKTGKWGVK